MLGTNPIRRQVLRQDGALEIEEVFYTIQGEGPFTGRPAVFVRTTGCWLACFWCDTQFERNVDKFTTPTKLLEQVVQTQDVITEPCKLIVLTGGDPLRQNIVPFCRLAVSSGYNVQIETAGLLWPPGLEQLLATPFEKNGVTIVCSPKTGKVCAEINSYAEAWKYIIRAGDELDVVDGLPNSSTQHQGMHQALARPPKHIRRENIFVQPCEEPRRSVAFGGTEVNQEVTARIAMEFGYRVSLQTHKILGLR